MSEGAEKKDEGAKAGAVSAPPSDVLEHLTRMTVPLEEAWSDGLRSKDAEDARREVIEAWKCFFATHISWTERTTERWRNWGLGELIVEEFPLKDSGLSRLDLGPATARRRYYQLMIAGMYALFDLADAINGLDEPSGRRVSIAGMASGESWWEAGAFALIRQRAASLAEVLRAGEECLKEVAAEAGAEQFPISNATVRRIWEGPLKAASGLVEHGWYEAALPQLLLALRAVLAEALSVAPEDLPVPLAPRVQGVELLSQVAAHLHLLEAACKRTGKGLPVDPGVAVPLAKEITPLVQRLACNPPSAEDLDSLMEPSREA